MCLWLDLYILFVGSTERRSSNSNSSHNIYHSRLDGTVSTSLVEDILSLVHAMATVLHTYLIDMDETEKKKKKNKKDKNKNKTKNDAASKSPEEHKIHMSTNDKVQMFISGIQHILSTLEHNQCERSKQMVSWYNTNETTNVIETICAAMNDSIRISESIEIFISDTIPIMIQTLLQEQQPLHHTNVNVIIESRNDTTNRNPSTTSTTTTTHAIRPAATDESYTTLQQSTNDLITLFSNHAVLLSEQISMFLVRNIKINSTIMTDFFSPSWENEWTSNELCRTMIQLYIHKYLLQCQQYLVGTNRSNHNMDRGDFENSEDEWRHQDRDSSRIYLFHKVITNTVRATICLYIRCLIQNKADPIALQRKDNYNATGTSRNSHQDSSYYFQNPQRALRRMYDDIRIMQKYFIRQFCPDHLTLQRIIIDEFSTLELLHECLLCCCNEHVSNANISAAATTTSSPTTTWVSSPSSSLESFIVVIHKRCTNGNAIITRYLVGDLYVLMSPPSLSKPRFRFLHHIQNKHNNNNAMYQQRITSIQNALQQLQPDLLLVTSRMKELKDQQISEHVPNSINYKSSDANAVSSFHQLNCMLQNLYEERMTQGILPVLCHSLCVLPYFDSNDSDIDDDEYYDGTNPKEMIAELFIHPIRTITRTLRR